MKIQAIVTPDGMLNILDYYFAPASDKEIYTRDKGVRRVLYMMSTVPARLYLYGDAGYRSLPGVFAPFVQWHGDP